MRYSVRFHPPNIPLTAELEWVLLRAYGPLHLLPPPGSNHLRLEAMQSLGLSSRVASRLPLPQLRDELGAAAAESLATCLRTHAARGLGLRALSTTVVTAARSIGQPVALLKFAALRHFGMVTETTRPASDLDILVAPAHAEALCVALGHSSLRRRELAEVAHHPAIMTAPSGLSVELHTHLPYVRLVPGGRFVTLPDLEEALLLERAKPDAPHLLVPTPELLVAHLVAHGIAQHGYEPKTYPAIRLLSDSIDVGLAGNEALALSAFRWLGTDVSYTELKSLTQIGQALVEGRPGELWHGNEPPARLLRHFVASVTNPPYRARLRLLGVLRGAEEDGVMETLQNFARAGFSTPRENLERLYGKKWGGSRWIRWLRPIDLPRRALLTLLRAVLPR